MARGQWAAPAADSNTGVGGDCGSQYLAISCNFSQFSCNFLFEETQKYSEPPVQTCCSLRLREVWLRHSNLPQFFAIFPQFFAIFAIFAIFCNWIGPSRIAIPSRPPPPSPTAVARLGVALLVAERAPFPVFHASGPQPVQEPHGRHRPPRPAAPQHRGPLLPAQGPAGRHPGHAHGGPLRRGGAAAARAPGPHLQDQRARDLHVAPGAPRALAPQKAPGGPDGLSGPPAPKFLARQKNGFTEGQSSLRRFWCADRWAADPRGSMVHQQRSMGQCLWPRTMRPMEDWNRGSLPQQTRGGGQARSLYATPPSPPPAPPLLPPPGFER